VSVSYAWRHECGRALDEGISRQLSREELQAETGPFNHCMIVRLFNISMIQSLHGCKCGEWLHRETTEVFPKLCKYACTQCFTVWMCAAGCL
jgi:hypothetical protein